MAPDSRSAGLPAQVEGSRQHQFQYYNQAPPSFNPGFHQSLPLSWGFQNEASGQFHWQPQNTYEGGHPCFDDDQALPNTFSGPSQLQSYDFASVDVPHNAASRQSFNTYNSLPQSNLPQQVNQAMSPAFAQRLPLHQQSTTIVPASHIAIPHLNVAQAGTKPYSEQTDQQSSPAPEANRPTTNQHQHLVPPSIDHYLSDAEEYKPGLSPSRARPPELATGRETKEASAPSSQYLCQSCQRVFMSNNSLKYVA